jgi:hypothetical protein
MATPKKRTWSKLAVLVVVMGLLLFIPAGTPSLLAGMGLLVGLYGGIRSHHSLSDEK